MNLSFSLLMILISYTHGQSLTSSEPVVKKPGESVTLSCTVSGLSLSYLHWIRQKPGKGLEWIGRIDSGTGTIFAQSVQDQFSITKDTNKNMLYLQVKSLKTEDTAVYYCAKGIAAGGFDYWGKGTSVTVTSGGQSAPTSLFAVSQCEASSDGFLTLGCVTSGFSPAASLQFSWTGDVTEQVQYPAVQNDDGKFTAVSHARVKASDWNAEKQFICQVQHAGSSTPKKQTLKKPVVKDLAPSLLLTTPSQADLNNGVASFICVAKQFSPKQYSFNWTLDNKEVNDRVKQTILTEEKSTFIMYTAVSVLELTADEWMNSVSSVNCEFEHKTGALNKEAKHAAQFSLKINPPPAKELFVNKKAVIDCVVTGDNKKEVSGAVVSWTVGGKSLKSSPTVTDGKETKAPFTRTSTLSIDETDWFKGDEVVCSTSAKQKTITDKIKVNKGGERPSVLFYKPEKSVSDTEMVSLVCEVSSSDLGDAYVMWEINKSYEDGNSMNTFKSKENKVVILSYLTVTGKQYNNDNIACAVKDANNITPLMIYTSTISGVAEPDITLLSREDENNIKLVCLLAGFYPLKYTEVKWLVDNQPVSKSLGRILQSRENKKTFTQISEIDVDIKKWNGGSEYTCQATHNPQNYNLTMSKCKAHPSFTPLINLEKPRLVSVKSGSERVTVSCVVEAAPNSKVSWILNGNERRPEEQLSGSTQRFISNLTLTAAEWEKHKNATCRVQQPCDINFLEKTINILDPPQKTPTVEIRRPLADDLRDSAVLECSARDLPSGDLSVSFQVNGRPFYEDEVNLPKDVHTLTTQVTVNQSYHINNNSFSCKIQQSPTNIWTSKSTGKIFGDPSVELLLVPNTENVNSELQKLICSGTGFIPKIRWFSNSLEKVATSNETMMQADGRMKVSSEIEVSLQEWTEGVEVTCQVNDLNKNAKKSCSICSVTTPFNQLAQVYLLGPSISNMRSSANVSLTCLVIGHRVKDFSITWRVAKKVYSQNFTQEAPKDHANGTQSVHSVLKLPTGTWEAYTEVSCEVKHRCSNKTQKQIISKIKDSKHPSVRILSPSDSDLSGPHNSTLLCLVTGFYPADISVHWELNGTNLDVSYFTNSLVSTYSAGRDFSMYSALTLPAGAQEHSTYSCIINHQSSSSPVTTSVDNIYASVINSFPSVDLLQSRDELVCLVYNYSPSAINITWLLDGVTVEQNHSTSSPAKGADGKFSVKSHLRILSFEWAPGSTYTCLVNHITDNITRNVSKSEILEQSIYFDENMSEAMAEEMAEEVWNMACAFIILFLCSLIYGCSVTLIKVKTG